MESQPPAPGPDASPRPGAQPSDAFAQALYARLRSRAPAASRYAIGAEIGHGGMGRVYAAHDEDLQRDVALKVIREAPGEGDTSGGPSPSSLRLARFLEEAQVTGQLDHPGIVPVHELGLDANGRLYFAMKLVRGEDLSSVLKRVGKDPEWTQTRVVGVLQKVCEAMAYAHSKRVIHRDLKPSNIRIGRFGAVYVMDWGLARVLDRPDERDLRVRAEDAATQSDPVHSDRQHAAGLAQLLHTVDGTPIGTPMFMSPEQALGRAELMGPQTDVYGIGAILYMLLTGQMPYVSPFSMVNAAQVVRWIREGPPTPILELAPKATAQLVAIAERAMARDPAQRYAHMGELADELRAYLELRVVRAYRTGPVAELGAWVRRNRSVATLAGALLVLAVSSGFGVAWQRSVAAHESERNSDAFEAQVLFDELESIAPLSATAHNELTHWSERADALTQRRADYEREVQSLLDSARADGTVEISQGQHPIELRYPLEVARADRERFARELAEPSQPPTPQSEAERAEYVRDVQAILPGTLAYLDERIAALSRFGEPLLNARFQSPALQQRFDLLQARLADLARVEHDGRREVERLRKLAARLHAVSNDAWRRAWDRFESDVQSPQTRAPYGVLRFAPRRDLVPLGRDPRSGLWEFWHTPSGERPFEGPGGWTVGPQSGLVFVLLPAAHVLTGASTKADAARVDPQATPIEFFSECDLDPFLISKYELTQGQWLRLTGVNPSRYPAGEHYNVQPRLSLANPVECVSHTECATLLARLGLALPTEAQFEYAARAGSDTPAPEPLTVSANGYSLPGDPLDRFYIHAPVGSLAPSGFGLFDVLGNVAEWCADWYVPDPREFELAAGTGERIPVRATFRVARGGAFDSGADSLRFSMRGEQRPDMHDKSIGVRPVVTLGTTLDARQ
ncbi:MAG: SUMF1/EgtB/PvdO family nonheme iron enzyme [Planctomycetes bacterium]|nr:SUMF1/EgtB/PvdO family nonheme iron enzyme [Planctomycetota bacterium]